MGNFLNHSKKSGNAYGSVLVVNLPNSPRHLLGYHLNSLRLLGDLRSTLNQDRTLLHFLVEHLERNSVDVLKLPRELQSVSMASRIE